MENYDPFYQWKCEEELRQRRRILEEQKRLEYENYLRSRSRRYDADVRQKNEEKNQQQFQIARDIFGNLHFIPMTEWEAPTGQNSENPYSYNVTPENQHIKKAIEHPEIRRSSKEETEFSKPKQKPQCDIRKKAKRNGNKYIVVEDASDSEDENTNTLEKTLRNRRPSPGNWLEPVEVMM